MDGRPYTPPAPSSENKMMARNKSFAASPHPGSDWDDDWGGASGAAAGGRGGAGAAGAGHGAQRSGSEYTLSQLHSSAADKDNFFARKQAENATRPEGLPPSQGGKYVGFGSAPAPRPAGGAAANGAINVDEVRSREGGWSKSGLLTMRRRLSIAAGPPACYAARRVLPSHPP